MRVLDILLVFRLDVGQISFDLVEKTFATKRHDSLPFLPQAPRFTTFCSCAEITIRTWLFDVLIFLSPFLFLLFFSFCYSD